MFHLDNNSGISSMPPAGAVESSAPRWFTEGGGGTPASYPGAAWFNIIQAELLNVLSAYGVAPDKADVTQLKKAIEEAIRQKATAASALLTAIAALNTSANKLPYFTGKDSVAMTDLTAFARTLLGRADAATILSDLGLPDLITGAVPVNLDTLEKLAAAIDNNPRYSIDVGTELGDRLRKDQNGKDIPDKPQFLKNVGIGPVATSAEIIAGTLLKMVDAAGLKSFLPKRSFSLNDYIRIPDVPGGLIIQWAYTSAPGVIYEQEIIQPLPIPFTTLNIGGMVTTVGTDANSDILFQVISNNISDVKVRAQVPVPNSNMTACRAFIVAIGF